MAWAEVTPVARHPAATRTKTDSHNSFFIRIRNISISSILSCLHRCLTHWLQTTCVVIVKQLFYLRFLIAERAGRVFSHRKPSEFRLQGMVDEKLTDERR